MKEKLILYLEFEFYETDSEEGGSISVAPSREISDEELSKMLYLAYDVIAANIEETEEPEMPPRRVKDKSHLKRIK